MQYQFANLYQFNLDESLIKVTPNQHPELQQLRNHIKSSFENIKCFLMPHPGLEVATSPEFHGELRCNPQFTMFYFTSLVIWYLGIHQEFKAQLGVLISRLFDPNNLVVKSINGQPVTCRELVVYFKAYSQIFQGEELPEPKSMLSVRFQN